MPAIVAVDVSVAVAIVLLDPLVALVVVTVAVAVPAALVPAVAVAFTHPASRVPAVTVALGLPVTAEPDVAAVPPNVHAGDPEIPCARCRRDLYDRRGRRRRRVVDVDRLRRRGRRCRRGRRRGRGRRNRHREPRARNPGVVVDLPVPASRLPAKPRPLAFPVSTGPDVATVLPLVRAADPSPTAARSLALDDRRRLLLRWNAPCPTLRDDADVRGLCRQETGSRTCGDRGEDRCGDCELNREIEHDWHCRPIPSRGSNSAHELRLRSYGVGQGIGPAHTGGPFTSWVSLRLAHRLPGGTRGHALVPGAHALVRRER